VQVAYHITTFSQVPGSPPGLQRAAPAGTSRTFFFFFFFFSFPCALGYRTLCSTSRCLLSPHPWCLCLLRCLFPFIYNPNNPERDCQCDASSVELAEALERGVGPESCEEFACRGLIRAAVEIHSVFFVGFVSLFGLLFISCEGFLVCPTRREDWLIFVGGLSAAPGPAGLVRWMHWQIDLWLQRS